MGIQFQAVQQNASLSFLPAVISSAAWLQRDTLKVGSFKVRKGGGKKVGENEMKNRRVAGEKVMEQGLLPPKGAKQNGGTEGLCFFSLNGV